MQGQEHMHSMRREREDPPGNKCADSIYPQLSSRLKAGETC